MACHICKQTGDRTFDLQEAEINCTICGRCEREQEEATDLINAGHTEHCAARQVWGDGECECGKTGIAPGPVSQAVLRGMRDTGDRDD